MLIIPHGAIPCPTLPYWYHTIPNGRIHLNLQSILFLKTCVDHVQKRLMEACGRQLSSEDCLNAMTWNVMCHLRGRPPPGSGAPTCGTFQFVMDIRGFEHGLPREYAGAGYVPVCVPGEGPATRIWFGRALVFTPFCCVSLAVPGVGPATKPWSGHGTCVSLRRFMIGQYCCLLINLLLSNCTVLLSAAV
jgi:hypothetical protein